MASVFFFMGDIDLKECRKRFRKVDGDSGDTFKCDCGSVCEDRTHMGERSLYENKREEFT